jgi:hypothetical protein
MFFKPAFEHASQFVFVFDNQDAHSSFAPSTTMMQAGHEIRMINLCRD